MPYYDYKCPSCGHEIDKKFVRKMDAPPPECPVCADERGEVVVMGQKPTAGGFKLEGGGWAKDGYG